MILFPQSKHLLGHFAVDFRNAMLQAIEQKVSCRSVLSRRRNVFPQTEQVNVEHASHTFRCGDGFGITSPHLMQGLGAIFGYGKRVLLNCSGCFSQYSLSCVAWHGLHKVIRLFSSFASRRLSQIRYGFMWWQSSVERVPTNPHSRQVNESRFRMWLETFAQFLPRYLGLLTIQL